VTEVRPAKKCFAHHHMTLAEYALYDIARAWSDGGRELLFFDGPKLARQFEKAGKDHMYKLRDSLLEKGWLVPVGDKSRRSNGHWGPGTYRVLSHDEYQLKHTCPVAREGTASRQGGNGPVATEGTDQSPQKERPVATEGMASSVGRKELAKENWQEITGNGGLATTTTSTVAEEVEASPDETVACSDSDFATGTGSEGSSPLEPEYLPEVEGEPQPDIPVQATSSQVTTPQPRPAYRTPNLAGAGRAKKTPSRPVPAGPTLPIGMKLLGLLGRSDLKQRGAEWDAMETRFDLYPVATLLDALDWIWAPDNTLNWCNSITTVRHTDPLEYYLQKAPQIVEQYDLFLTRQAALAKKQQNATNNKESNHDATSKKSKNAITHERNLANVQEFLAEFSDTSN
jgi:hypothetical protein